MKNTFRISNNHHKEQRLIHTLRLSAMTTCGSFRFKGRTSRFQQFKISVVPHGRSGWVRFNILIVWFSTYLTGSGVKKKKKKKDTALSVERFMSTQGRQGNYLLPPCRSRLPDGTDPPNKALHSSKASSGRGGWNALH